MGRHALIRPADRYIVVDVRSGQIMHAVTRMTEAWKLASALNVDQPGAPFRVQPFDADQFDWVNDAALIERVRKLHTVPSIDADTILLTVDERQLAAYQARKQAR